MLKQYQPQQRPKPRGISFKFSLPTILFNLLCLLLLTDVAMARDYYYCDCGTAASVGCVSGSDTNDGLSASSARQTFLNARQTFVTNSLFSSGDSINFCKGGSFKITHSSWLNTNCKQENDCILKDYTPSWGDNLPKPIIYRDTDGMGFSFDDGGQIRPDGGISFRNLDMRCINCSGGASWGFFIYNDADNINIDNLTFNGWAIAIHLAGSGTPPSGSLGNGINENIKIINSTIKNSYVQGILGGANNLLIENNILQKNGGPSLLDHNIYISKGDNVTIRNNDLYQSALDAGGNCIGVSLVVHGQINHMLIENNYIHEDIGKAGQGCWGIAVDTGYGTREEFRNITIRGNRVVNVGNMGIGLNACQDCLIENNIIVHEQSFGQASIAVPDRGRTTTGEFADLAMERVTVRNNSVLVKTTGNGGTGITLSGEGSGHLLVNNAVHYTGTGTFNCFNAGLASGNYTAIGHNVCGFPSANASSQWEVGSGTSPDPLTAWKNVSSLGQGSKLGIPGFTDITTSPYNLRAINESARVVNGGHPTLSAPKDILGNSRDSSPDVGAYESSAADVIAPSAPMNLRKNSL